MKSVQMNDETSPRLPAAVLERRALERWEGEGGAVPVDPARRPEAGRRTVAPRKKRAVRKDAPGGKGGRGAVNLRGKRIGGKKEDEDQAHEHSAGIS